MLRNKDKAIELLQFALLFHQTEAGFFAERSNWTEDKVSIYSSQKEIDFLPENFTLDKAKLDITHLWSSSTLIEGVTLYIHPFSETGQWTLIGATTGYDHDRFNDKGSILGLFFTQFLQEKDDKILIEGISPTAVMTHFVYQLGKIETNSTISLTIPNFKQPVYRVYNEKPDEMFSLRTQPQIIQNHPYLEDIFKRVTQPDDKIDLRLQINNIYVHIVRDQDWKGYQ